MVLNNEEDKTKYRMYVPPTVGGAPPQTQQTEFDAWMAKFKTAGSADQAKMLSERYGFNFGPTYAGGAGEGDLTKPPPKAEGGTPPTTTEPPPKVGPGKVVGPVIATPSMTELYGQLIKTIGAGGVGEFKDVNAQALLDALLRQMREQGEAPTMPTGVAEGGEEPTDQWQAALNQALRDLQGGEAFPYTDTEGNTQYAYPGIGEGNVYISSSGQEVPLPKFDLPGMGYEPLSLAAGDYQPDPANPTKPWIDATTGQPYLTDAGTIKQAKNAAVIQAAMMRYEAQLSAVEPNAQVSRLVALATTANALKTSAQAASLEERRFGLEAYRADLERWATEKGVSLRQFETATTLTLGIGAQQLTARGQDLELRIAQLNAAIGAARAQGDWQQEAALSAEQQQLERERMGVTQRGQDIELQMAQMQTGMQQYVADLQAGVTQRGQDISLQLADIDARVDRYIAEGNWTQAAADREQRKVLETEQMDIQRQGNQIGLLSALAANPIGMFSLMSMGFDFSTVGLDLGAMFGQLQADGIELPSAEDFNRMTEQQRAQLFATFAQKGMSPADIIQRIQQQRPGGLGTGIRRAQVTR